MLIYRQVDSISIGECFRYRVEVDCSRSQEEWNQLTISIKNTESPLSHAYFLQGPFFISAQVFRGETLPGAFQQKEAPKYTPLIKPAQRWTYQIPLPEGHGKVERTISVLSELIFSRSAKVPFEIRIELGHAEGTLPKNGSAQTTLNESASPSPRPLSPLQNHPQQERPDESRQKDYVDSEYIKVFRYTPWDNASASCSAKRPKRHLVILQHGLHATRNDLLYIKERLEESSKSAARRAGQSYNDLDVVACPDNHGLTENGIAICGQRLALFLLSQTCWTIDGDVEAIEEVPYDRISFVAHSFGGPICLYAMAYVETVSQGQFFKAIKPTSLVCFASPLLGVGAPIQLLKTFLGTGVLGQTGSDLGLRPVKRRPEEVVPEIQTGMAVLEALSQPGGAAHKVVEAFETRTVYANICNDSVVPLAVAALLFVEPDEEQKAQGIRSWPPESPATAISDAPIAGSDSLGSPFSKLTAKFADPLRLVNDLFNPHPSERLDPLKAVLELLQPALPPEAVFLAPQKQDEPIIYDKFSLEQIPLHGSLASMSIEEKIARNWHTSKADYDSVAIQSLGYSPLDQKIVAIKAGPVPTGGLRWRKVLLKFDREIDAHTNVIMRRLASSWGWNVIEHFVKVHPWQRQLDHNGVEEGTNKAMEAREEKEDRDATAGPDEDPTRLEMDGEKQPEEEGAAER